MNFSLWSAIVGLLLVSMALGYTRLARLPLSTSLLYLLVGAALSPLWLDLVALDPMAHSEGLERLAEVVVLLSLFTSGLKMSLTVSDGRWALPLRLATLSMLVTAGLIAALGVFMLGLPLGAAVLLGGILAPTDPVLAADVQVSQAGDRDRLRLSLTGEAGLNDGTAFPIVMLGLGLLGLHELGPYHSRWVAVDVLWAVGAGLGIGGLLGTLVGRVVLHLRSTRQEAIGLDNFLALGLIGLSYGLANLAHGYGFLAVFAAGLALRRLEEKPVGGAADQALQQGARPDQAPPAAAIAEALASPDRASAEKAASDPAKAPAFMAHAVLSFNEQVERIGEFAAVAAVGMLLWALDWGHASWAFVAVVLLVIRPVSVVAGLLRSDSSRTQRALIGWFGIRGIGSLFYLAYAMNHGLDTDLASQLATLTFSVMVVSIVVHGISVTPLMNLYERRKEQRRSADAARAASTGSRGG
ncbi:cation:proton antiporter [Piscinibacter koreensis]|uniref:Cation:proton antiporter n=1 Tax=Piscinibacter koreensis TaxID=2742824 RepID=A0A7Y6NM95_9BURK|nr:cation:proton antiporter [Schlegelella koreensis]NUZ05791.1 cation:proton antiporter [Schlegelella koreensis]